uniref:D-glycero-beta-D-manno-heptose 1-phosphate adenylyltransferase n=1 Tax=Thermosporothrix sp. COM3 TaxID=2490863 RepID=A0A455STS6_9CHLR|nr:hypothetical protein KTC_52920 [Thermosporothrix sp. COM3]
MKSMKNRNMQLSIQQKILARATLADIVRQRQAAGEQAVFTNGCFDLLHLGHVRYLQEARDLGDFLIVGLNADASVRRLKGEERPLVPQEERAEILAALQMVDYITIFDEPTAEELVNTLRPSIYVKGADYASVQNSLPDPKRLPEAAVVQAYGGSVRLLAYIPNHSTTELIARIQRLPSRS